MPATFGYNADGEGNWLARFFAIPYGNRNPVWYGKAMLEVCELWRRLDALYPEDMDGVYKWTFQ